MATRVALFVLLQQHTSDVIQALRDAVPAPLSVEIMTSEGLPDKLLTRMQQEPRVACVVICPNNQSLVDNDVPDMLSSILLQLSDHCPSTFRIVFSDVASNSPLLRYELCSSYQCNMVTHVLQHLTRSLQTLANETHAGPYACPVCNKQKLSAAELWAHLPMYHVNSKKSLSMTRFPCPICDERSREPLTVHVHENHAPPGVHVEAGRSMPPLVSFGLCVIQRKSDKKFLVVQEYENQGFWLPGGGIDGAELPDVAAQRECVEEAGIRVELTGILRVEVNPGRKYTRMRYIFYGHPVCDDDPCKTFPDFESVGACWVGLDDFKNPNIRWRGEEPEQWFHYVANGGYIAPMGILGREGAEPDRSLANRHRSGEVLDSCKSDAKCCHS